MYKNIIVLFCSFIICCSIVTATPLRWDIANAVNQDQRMSLQPHKDQITQALPILEQDLKEHQNLLAEYREKHRLTEQKLSQEDNFFSRQKLKTKLIYYADRIDHYESQCEQKELQVIIYRYVTSLLNNESVAFEIVRKDKNWISMIEAKATWAIAQQASAKQRWLNAQERIMSIPMEQQTVQQTIANLQKQLDILEYKKSWSNLEERLSLQSKIAYEKARFATLEGEIFVQDKIKQDSWQEIQAMKIEQTEAEVAAIVLKKY